LRPEGPRETLLAQAKALSHVSSLELFRGAGARSAALNLECSGHVLACQGSAGAAPRHPPPQEETRTTGFATAALKRRGNALAALQAAPRYQSLYPGHRPSASALGSVLPARWAGRADLCDEPFCSLARLPYGRDDFLSRKPQVNALNVQGRRLGNQQMRFRLRSCLGAWWVYRRYER